MPLGIHALDIGIVIAPLDFVGRHVGLAGANGTASQQTDCGSDSCTLAPASHSPGCRTKRGTHDSTLGKTVIGRLIGCRPANLFISKLPA